MLSLAIDTSTLWGRFALAEDGEILVYQPYNVSGSYADALLPVIDDLFQRTDRKLSDLQALGICHGPGSFTGLRIGVATAKSLAWSLGIQLYACSTLEVMAAAMLREHPAADVAVPALDARRGEIFAGIYERDRQWVRALADPVAQPADLWWQCLLTTVQHPDAPVYAGNGAEILLGSGESLRPELLAATEPVRRRWNSAHPATAPALAQALSATDNPIAAVHPFTLTPLYLRASEAEVKRGLDLTPDTPQADVESRLSGDREPS
jgi:tRNA threonylcarbamoyladenosine biosynthesis protein TsaB